MKKLILSSASPRRKELLEQIGLRFDIIISDIDENVGSGEQPHDIVKTLALRKAKNVYEKINDESAVVVGADTVVVHNGKILGKPSDENDAFEILKELSGSVNNVYTGVAIVSCKNTVSFYEETKVYMKDISEKEIREYIRTKEPMDKAGAYAIQGIGAVFVDKIEGDYSNVVGLPLSRLYEEIKKIEEDFISWK